MIEREKLMAIQHIVTHITCGDGMACALMAKTLLPDARLSFLQYNTKEHEELEPEPGMVFLDFSPARGKEQPFIDAGAIVMDHHAMQRSMVERFGELGIWGENEKLESGAVLTYENLWKPIKDGNAGRMDFFVEQLAKTVAVYDTWQKNDDRFLAAWETVETLLFWPFEKLHDNFHPDDWPEVAVVGSNLVMRRKDQAVRTLAQSYLFRSVGSEKVRLFQADSPTTNIVADLAFDCDVVAGFHCFTEENVRRVKYSVRSRHGFDVGTFCRDLGGGGHRAAASFVTELKGNDPYTLFQHLFRYRSTR